MKMRPSKYVSWIIAIAFAGLFAAGPALAQGRGHDERNDHGQPGWDHKNEHAKERARDRREHPRFDDHHREMVRHYFEERKRNHRYREVRERRYVIGKPLPRGVIFHELPKTLIKDFGTPPRGYRYVRVSNDVLLISAITGLVVDALQN